MTTGGSDVAIDLGCGTGLFGAEIRDRVAHLEGFDLSVNMLAKAEEKSLYDLLAKADLRSILMDRVFSLRVSPKPVPTSSLQPTC